MPTVEPTPGALAALLALLVYLVAAGRARRTGPGWQHGRTVAFTVGALLLAYALADPAVGFPAHMRQHLLIGMLAPLGLVLGAPLTLLLRTVDVHTGRRVVRLLRSRPARVLSHPVTGLLLTAGGLWVLYLTPLYRATEAYPLAHDLVHLHFLAAGYLFTWSITGPDPGPHRPGVPFRLVVLGVSIVAHATCSQLMYAGLLVDVPAPPEQLRAGATVMYYGGDLAEILLALAMLTTWRPARPRVATSADTDRPIDMRDYRAQGSPRRWIRSRGRDAHETADTGLRSHSGRRVGGTAAGDG